MTEMQDIARRLDDIVEAVLKLRRELLAHPRDAVRSAIDTVAADGEMLEPIVLAERTGLTAQHIRRLCRNGFAEGRPGFEKMGGRYRATLDAISQMRV